MNATGRKMTTSDSDVAATASVTSLVPSMAAWKGGSALFVDLAEDVLQHDDRVVDDDADGEREAEQRHAC